MERLDQECKGKSHGLEREISFASWPCSFDKYGAECYPDLHLTFLQAFSKVLSEIRRIQSEFLWCDSENKRIVIWVSWKTVCKPQNQGGICIKDVEVVNKVLLCKWKWRILNKHNAIWGSFIRARYKSLKIKVLVGDKNAICNDDSIWWNDLVLSNSYSANEDSVFLA